MICFATPNPMNFTVGQGGSRVGLKLLEATGQPWMSWKPNLIIGFTIGSCLFTPKNWGMPVVQCVFFCLNVHGCCPYCAAYIRLRHRIMCCMSCIRSQNYIYRYCTVLSSAEVVAFLLKWLIYNGKGHLGGSLRKHVPLVVNLYTCLCDPLGMSCNMFYDVFYVDSVRQFICSVLYI